MQKRNTSIKWRNEGSKKSKLKNYEELKKNKEFIKFITAGFGAAGYSSMQIVGRAHMLASALKCTPLAVANRGYQICIGICICMYRLLKNISVCVCLFALIVLFVAKGSLLNSIGMSNQDTDHSNLKF